VAEERVQRRLAAILAADVVGYSRLMDADEAGTLARLKAIRAEVFDPKIAAFGGRVFKNTGDGALAEFSSAVDAVQCAVDIQNDLAARPEGTSGDQLLVLRIGISQGDVIVDGDDLFGNGVNVAARMEGLAEPGGICISGNVREHVGNSLDVTLEDMGDQTVKNIDRPVRCYRVHLESRVTAEVSSPPLPDKPSIAVLPFENMSGDPEQEYFSDGIAEDIITELSKISGLFVIARHSSFTYKGKSVTLKQVGQELGVRYALEGSVRKAGNRLRITAQLIDTATDHHLWAERYDRDLEDIFAVQDDVTREITAALKVAIPQEDLNRLGRPPTKNVMAYDLYLQARTGFQPPTVENILWARRTYERVVEIDPAFSGAYAWLSMTYTRPILLHHYEKTEEDVAKAREYADEALRLDDKLAAAHMAQSCIALVTGSHDAAIAFARNAVDLQPGDADANANLARISYLSGHPEDAFEPFKTAARLDPQGPGFKRPLGFAYCMAGRFNEAIEVFRRAGAGMPGQFLPSPMFLGAWVAAAIEVGNADEAATKAKELLAMVPDFKVSEFSFLERFAVTGMKDRMATALIKAGLPE